MSYGTSIIIIIVSKLTFMTIVRYFFYSFGLLILTLSVFPLCFNVSRLGLGCQRVSIHRLAGNCQRIFSRLTSENDIVESIN